MTVLKHLRQILAETREPKATFAEVAVKFGSGENVVRKFERGETAPRYDETDRFVESYAEATGTSVFDLWDEALRRAKEDAKVKQGAAPTAAEAAARELRPRRPQRPRQKRQTGS